MHVHVYILVIVIKFLKFDSYISFFRIYMTVYIYMYKAFFIFHGLDEGVKVFFVQVSKQENSLHIMHEFKI